MPGEQQSPTALVLQYLASKGLQPTARNVSAALQMNAQNPGAIPGLTNQAPPPPDAPAPATGQPSGQGPGPGSPPMPVPPIPPGAPPAPLQQQAAQPIAAQPQQDPGQSQDWLSKLMQVILGGGAGAMAGAGAGNAAQVGVGGNGAEPMGNRPMPPTGRMMDVPGAAIGGPGPQLALPGGQQPQLGGPQLQVGGPQAPAPVGQPQVGGPPQGAPQLPAPGERPAIPMPNGASGPTIHLPTSGLSGMGEPLPGRSAMPEMGSGIDWGKVLGELPALLKGVAR